MPRPAAISRTPNARIQPALRSAPRNRPSLRAPNSSAIPSPMLNQPSPRAVFFGFRDRTLGAPSPPRQPLDEVDLSHDRRQVVAVLDDRHLILGEELPQPRHRR